MLKNIIIKKALSVGFCAAGITSAEPVNCARYIKDAAEAGRIGEMKWLSREPQKRCNPRALLADADSVICCAWPYSDRRQQTADRRLKAKKIARFAQGEDYHKVVRNKLEELFEEIKKHEPNVHAKICVDTSPIFEKALAERAGLGWIGKHTILLNEKFGSWFVLGEIITDLKLKPDAPAKDLCGDCTKCIDACPTGAILKSNVLDARKCISYQTIEAAGRNLDKAERYGCDICQEACPYNRECFTSTIP